MKKAILLIILLFYFLASYKTISDSSYTPTPLPDNEQIVCVVNAIHYEAGNQKWRGKRAVFDVIENRSKKWDKSWCEIIKMKNQFSFYPKKWKKTLDFEDWKLYYDVVVGEDAVIDEDVLWYHAHYVSPKWKLRRVVRIDDHIFYREK